MQSKSEKFRQQMLIYEADLISKGYSLIAGVDEAGRGPLAGPVVAAAVLLDQNRIIPGINDSKKLTGSRREFLYNEIMQNSSSFGIGIVHNDTIDRINILQASLKAMCMAIQNMLILPDYVLVDGHQLPDLDLPMKALIAGDSTSLSIAAASILAKVTRDHIMLEYDRIYPQFGFGRNKGYPTPEHLKALKAFGPCEIHRRSFSPVSQLEIQLM